MAAFFAINITEFRRDAGGTLGLSYVSKMMCEFSKILECWRQRMTKYFLSPGFLRYLRCFYYCCV
jgi:hypothetical protein